MAARAHSCWRCRAGCPPAASPARASASSTWRPAPMASPSSRATSAARSTRSATARRGLLVDPTDPVGGRGGDHAAAADPELARRLGAAGPAPRAGFAWPRDRRARRSRCCERSSSAAAREGPLRQPHRRVSGGERSLLGLLGALPAPIEPLLAAPPGRLRSSPSAELAIPTHGITGTAGSLAASAAHAARAAASWRSRLCRCAAPRTATARRSCTRTRSAPASCSRLRAARCGRRSCTSATVCRRVA